MKSKTVAPLGVRIVSCLMAFVLAIGLTPITVNTSWAANVPFTAKVAGEAVQNIDVLEKGYKYTPYQADPEELTLYTIALSEGITDMSLSYGSDYVLNYAYDKDGNFLGSYVDNYKVGAQSFEVNADLNNDSVLDFILVQTPYDESNNSTVLYVITFKYLNEGTDSGNGNNGNENNGVNNDSGSTENQGEGSGGDQNQNPITESFDEADLNTLVSNLSARFSASGADADITNDTWNAAVAMNNKGAGNKLSKEKILDNLSAEIDSIAPGTLAKYIVALTSAGVDCTNVTINGSSRNLIEQMDETMGEGLGDYGIYSYVCILPAYDFGGYEQTPKAKIAKSQIVNEIIQQKSSITNYFDYQTAAQAILALYPYAGDSSVANFINDLKDFILANQDTSGGFPGWSGISVDTTATVVAALCALGIDSTTVAKDGGANPIDYLVTTADEDLKGYEDTAEANELMAASTALFGLVAYQNSIQNNGQYYVYNKTNVESQQEPQGSSTQQSDGSNASGDITSITDNGQQVTKESNGLPNTGDTVPLVTTAVFALLAGLTMAGSYLSRRVRNR